MKYLLILILFKKSLSNAGRNNIDIDLGPFTKMMKYALAAAKNPRVNNFIHNTYNKFQEEI